MTCTHLNTAGLCKNRYPGVRVNPVMCGACPSYNGPARGAGDVIADAIKFASLGIIKPCGGCGKRRAWVNERLPA